MATVRVLLADARDRHLPPVSVRSGQPADGYAPAGRKPIVMRVPLTQAEFDRSRLLERHKRSAVRRGIACTVIGVAMARFPAILPFGLVIGVVSAALWVVAHLALKRLLPTVEFGPDGHTVVLHGVHKAFVAAVSGTD